MVDPVTDEPANPSLGKTHTVPDLTGRTILIVEDVESNLLLLQAILKPTGATLQIARNGAEAIEVCRKALPDLILMDMLLPVVDGITAATRIRDFCNATQHVPIIALTAQAMTGQRESYLRMGLDGYLAKPVNVAEVLALAGRFLGAGS